MGKRLYRERFKAARRYAHPLVMGGVFYVLPWAILLYFFGVPQVIIGLAAIVEQVDEDLDMFIEAIADIERREGNGIKVGAKDNDR